jgi:cell division protein FtsW
MRPGHGIVLAAVSLLLLGVLMVNSVALAQRGGEGAGALSEAPSPGPVDAARLLWGRPTLYALLAAGMLAAGSLVPVGRIARLSGAASPLPWLAGGSVLLLLLVYAPNLGREVNGARRWVELGPLNLQPSEVAKWCLPLCLAWWCVARGEAIRGFFGGFLPPLAMVLVVCGLVGAEDLGTAVLIFAVSMLVLLAGGVRARHLMLLPPIGALGAAAAIIHSPYRLRRLDAWQDPFADPQGIGYHVIQSLSAIAGGGLSGRGLGHGVQKFGYLPEGTTDFIYAIICEELGLLGAVMTVLLFALLLWCGLEVLLARGRAAEAGREREAEFSQLLGLGILLNVGLQALINITVVVGLAPTKGIALPLVSHGGTGWLLTAFSLGMLLAIERESGTRRPKAAAATPAAVAA